MNYSILSNINHKILFNVELINDLIIASLVGFFDKENKDYEICIFILFNFLMYKNICSEYWYIILLKDLIW